MKVEEAIKVLTDFNKWRRGEHPYEWNEDPSLMIEFPFDVKEVGEAIDEAINMLKHADDMECEKKYEYAERYGDGIVSSWHESEMIDRKLIFDDSDVVRRVVGEWEEVP